MTKEEFLQLMKFPKEWLTFDMYPDELFQKYIELYQVGDEQGSEHDRNGAFHWWLRRQPTREQLEKLLRLAALDPDLYLGDSLRQYIASASAYDDDLMKLDEKLFRNHPKGK